MIYTVQIEFEADSDKEAENVQEKILIALWTEKPFPYTSKTILLISQPIKL